MGKHEHLTEEATPHAPRKAAGAAPEASFMARMQATAGNRAVARAVAQRRVASSSRLSVQRNDKFDAAHSKTLTKEGAPEELELPKELAEGMQAAWAGSMPAGKSQEQGGILVMTKEGRYQWRAGPPGTSAMFSPNYGDVKEGETIIAVGHTHPYDASEGGHENVSFSGQDLARLVYVADRMAVVQSGKTRFVASRTKAFDDLVAAADTDIKKRALFDEISKLWDDEFAAARKAKTKFVEAVEVAAKVVCERYHFVYYVGEGDTVSQPKPPKVHVEVKPPTTPDVTPTTPSSTTPSTTSTPETGVTSPPSTSGSTAQVEPEPTSIGAAFKGWLSRTFGRRR